MTGCNVAQDILDWEPLDFAAFNGVVSILETYGVLAATRTIWAVIANLSAPALPISHRTRNSIFPSNPPPSGALNEIETVLGLIAGQSQGSVLANHDQLCADHQSDYRTCATNFGNDRGS